MPFSFRIGGGNFSKLHFDVANNVYCIPKIENQKKIVANYFENEARTFGVFAFQISIFELATLWRRDVGAWILVAIWKGHFLTYFQELLWLFSVYYLYHIWLLLSLGFSSIIKNQLKVLNRKSYCLIANLISSFACPVRLGELGRFSIFLYQSTRLSVSEFVCLFVCSITPPKRRTPATSNLEGWLPLG